MDQLIQEVAQHYEEKIKKKAGAPRRQISHIDAFYGQNYSHGPMRGDDVNDGSFGLVNRPNNNESAVNLNLLI